AGGIEVMGQRAIIHPSYNPDRNGPNENDFDIALLELQTPVTNRQTIPLLSATAPALTEDTRLIVMGWGTTRGLPDGTGADSSNTLLQATLAYVNTEQCNQIYQGDITANMLCMNGVSATDTSDNCSGDSGGPAILPSGTGFIEVGIASFSMICGDPTLPTVYARVSNLNDFIRQNVPEAQFVAPGGTTPPTTPPSTATPIDNCQATFDAASAQLTIPCVFLEGQMQYFSVTLKQQAPSLNFELEPTSVATTPFPDGDAPECEATYDLANMTLAVPCVGVAGSAQIFSIMFSQVSAELVFTLDPNIQTR
ncbi:MAG: serine protease, partial [Pseudomonadota bacterium]